MRPVLSQNELQRRIRAARVLANISQAEMNRGGHQRGLPKNTLGKVERGDLAIRHVHLAMLCEILEVPMSWFTEPREVIVAQRASDYLDAIREILTLLSDNPVKLGEEAVLPRVPTPPPPPDESGPEATGEAETG
jgi:transcriptional regulator with XRE-family HTH domain